MIAAMVKYYAEVHFGYMTQCLVRKTIEKILTATSTQVMDNVCLKVNVKTGGVNWAVTPAFSL